MRFLVPWVMFPHLVNGVANWCRCKDCGVYCQSSQLFLFNGVANRCPCKDWGGAATPLPLVLFSPFPCPCWVGIGKSTTFQAFTDVCSVVFPSVVPIYITCLNLNAEHPLATHALYRTILNNLQSRGYIQFDEADEGKTTQELLFAKLEHYPGVHLRIVIIIDELDQLYMRNPRDEPDMCRQLLRTLSEIGYLGEQKSGFILTFLCGSSTRLYQLVTAVKDDESIKIFPVLASAPNLNPTKFCLLRIYSSLPTDLDTACRILVKPEGVDMGIYRFFLLYGGATARALGCLRTDDFKEPDAMFPSLSTKSVLYPAELLLRDQIYDWMKKNNESLLWQYFSPEYKPDELSRVEWNKSAEEGGFKPCPYPEVQKMTGSLQRAGEVFPFKDDALETLRRLVDASLVVLDLADEPALIFVYPRRVLEIGLLYLDDDRARAAATTLSQKVLKKFGEVKPGSIASGVSAVAHVIELLPENGI